MGRPFRKNFLILVKRPRDSRKKSGWFRCKKTSQKLKSLNFECEQSERYFSSYSILFTALRMSHAKNFPGDRRKAWVKIRLKARPCINDYNYLVFPFHFQLCKIIIAIAKCAVKICFLYQKNKRGSSSLLCICFAHYSFFVTEFKKLYSNQIFTFTLFVLVTFSSLKKIKITWSTLRDSVIQR